MPDAAIVELPRNVVPEPDVVLYRVDLPDVLDQRLVLLREPTSARARPFACSDIACSRRETRASCW